MEKWRIRYSLWLPFTEMMNENNKSFMIGVCADLYEGIRHYMDFNYEVTVQPDLAHGKLLENKTWSGMIGSMLRNETDISGPFFISYERSKIMQFSNPLTFSELAIVSGVESTQRGAFLLLSIFTLEVWISLFVTLLVVASACCLIYFLLPSEHKKEKLEIFFRYMWVFLTALLGKSFGGRNNWYLKHVEASTSFRLLEGLWCCVGCVVLMNTYQGTIMSTFAVDKPKVKIESLDDLVKDPKMAVGNFRGSSTDTVLLGLKGTQYESVWQRSLKVSFKPLSPFLLREGEVPDWIKDVEEGKMVFFAETMFMKTLVGINFINTRKCKLRVTPVNLGSSIITLGLRKELSHTDFMKKFNKGVRYYFEGDLTHKEMMKSAMHYEICSKGYTPEPKPLKIDDILGAFIILIIGILSSALLLVIEILTSQIKIGKKMS